MVLTKRIAYKITVYFFTILFALTLNFSLPRIAPGDPLDYLFGPQVTSLTDEERTRILHEFGLDGSIYEQYWRYLVGIVHGDLGTSIQFGTEVHAILVEKLPWTLILVGSSLAISTIFGTLLGIISAWKRSSNISFGVLTGMLALDSMPGFWIGMILISIFALYFGWFPSFGATSLSFSDDYFTLNLEIVKRLVLPIATLTLATIGGTYLLARAAMITTLGESYLFMAEAKGASEWRLIFHHALRNVILPIYSRFTISLGTIVSGSVVVETIFSYPGIGLLIYESVLTRDYPLMQGSFLIITISVISVNVIADLTYPLLDPRVRRNRNGH